MLVFTAIVLLLPITNNGRVFDVANSTHTASVMFIS